MAKSKVSARPVVDKGLRQIDQDLMACRQALMCAADSLGRVEQEFGRGESAELGVAAIRVVERCSKELMRIEESVDRLRMEAARS